MRQYAPTRTAQQRITEDFEDITFEKEKKENVFFLIIEIVKMAKSWTNSQNFERYHNLLG